MAVSVRLIGREVERQPWRFLAGAVITVGGFIGVVGGLVGMVVVLVTLPVTLPFDWLLKRLGFRGFSIRSGHHLEYAVSFGAFRRDPEGERG